MNDTAAAASGYRVGTGVGERSREWGGLAALGLPGGKRGGEIRYRVADIGRRRARGGAREEWCERRGLGGGGVQGLVLWFGGVRAHRRWGV